MPDPHPISITNESFSISLASIILLRMLGKVDSQNGQELLDMNEKGVSIPKKDEKKKPD